MNNDTISRQAAIDAICEHGTDLERRGIAVLSVANHKQVTVDLLENLPSAERQEVQSSECEYWDDESNFCTLYRPSAERRGRWIPLEKEIGLYECSICGHKILRAECNYCPNCGAAMKGPNEND